MGGSTSQLQDKVAELNAQVERLRQQNKVLLEQLQDTPSSKLTGYLYKTSSVPWGMISSDWELRFFVLNNTVLQYYQSERDTVFNPRGELDLTGCHVKWEGLHSGRFWAFSIVDQGDTSLLRLSSTSKATAQQWFATLKLQCEANLALDPSSSHGHKSGHQRAPLRQTTIQGGKPTVSIPSQSVGDPHPHHPERPKSPRPSSAHRGPMLGSTPVHTAAKFSYLSSERHWQEKHTGLYNLGLVVLVCTNFRLALENALKYGWRVNPLRKLSQIVFGHGNIALAMCYPALMGFALIALLNELLAAKLLRIEQQLEEELSKKQDLGPKHSMALMRRQARYHELPVTLINIANITAALVLPCYIMTSTVVEPLSGFLLALLCMICWMKLVSYAHCNYDLRAARREGEVRPGERGSPDTPPEWALLQYPENLSLANMAHFMVAPTLVYQPNYPRSPRVRKRWLVRRFLELALMLTILAIIVEQYIEPAVTNSIKPLQEMEALRLVERILKLAIPNLYAWLCMFYVLFHVWLNILAELLCFGDREFYKDWWNAATIGEYWKLWNMPVHQWLLRHCYFPAISWGMPRFWAMVLVFLVSAVAHELVVGVPLHMVRFWAFGGIMFQIPLIVLTEHVRKKVKRNDWGNYVFWIAFCIVGQPVSVLMYCHDYMIEHHKVPGGMAVNGPVNVTL